MSFKNNEHYFLAGGGEMGELIRAKDWSKTSLGDPGYLATKSSHHGRRNAG
jgi:hypothetical protein